MSYQDLIESATQIPEFDIDELSEPDNAHRARALLESCRASLRAARAAIATRPSMPTEFSAEYFSNHTPQIQKLRQLALALQLQGIQEKRNGNFVEAVSCCLDLVHLAHCQRRNGLIVDLLSGCATWSKGITGLVDLRDQLDAVQRARLMRLLIESEAECEPTTTVIARDALWTSIVEFPPFDEAEFRESLSAELSAEEVEDFVAFHRMCADQLPSGDQGHCYDASDRSLAYQRLLVVDLAIGNYRAVHNVPPPDLGSLVPEFLLARMPDPFTNSDFIYRIERGEPVLYSVGAKRRDLGGVRGGWAAASVGLADMFLE